MRNFWLMLGAIALVAAACSDGDSSPTGSAGTSLGTSTVGSATSAASPTTSVTTTLAPSLTLDPSLPRYGGEVVISAVEQPTTLNPFAPGGDASVVAIIGQTHLAGAYDIDPESGELVPELVVQIPSVENQAVVINDDGTMDVRWDIHRDARWSDGFPVTGQDMAFTLDFRAAVMECSGFGFPPRPLPNIEQLEVGEKTFVARFPTASFDHELLFEWIVPRHAVVDSDYCQDWNTKMWPAAGPFVLEEWVREGADRHLRLVRNSNYWKVNDAGMQLPYLDSVVFQFAEDSAAAVAGFTTRSADVISPAAFVSDLPLDSWREGGASVQIVPGPVWEHLNFQFGPGNRNPDSLNGLLSFRRAIAHGLDRRALLDDAGFPWLDVSSGFLTYFTRAASREPWNQYGYDPARAGALLAAACEQAGRDCAADPPRVVYSTTSNDDFRSRVADQVVAQLGAIGVQVELALENSQQFFGETLEEGSWDVGNWPWVGAPGSQAIVDILARFDPQAPPPDGRNVYNWGTPGSGLEQDEAVLQFTILLDLLRATADAADVVALSSQAERILAEQAVVIPLNARAVLGAVWADEIQGFVMHPLRRSMTWNVETWYRIGE